MSATKLPGFVLFSFLYLFALRSDAGVPQSWSSSTPTNKNLTAAMYGQSEFIVVGWGSMVIRSLNGFDWAQALQLPGPPGTAIPDHLFCAAYGNGMFVAGGQQNMLLAISPDGVNWTNIFSTIGREHLYGLTFGNGRFVGVGLGSPGSGQDSYIITSINGIDWRGPSSSPTTNCLYGVAFGNGLYVAVGELGAILTSPDGSNWTVQNSGTTKNLRAITFTGSRFIAGGDSSTMVTSTDGLSWSPSAPPSFDVTGLASGGGAVVAVGVYNGTDGRLHASSDGLGWPGNPTLVSQPLNGIAYVNDRFVALGNNGLIVQSDSPNQNGTNIWSKPTSGYWEEPYWSLGEAPSFYQDVMFTNSGYKALAIGYGTALNYPNSLAM
ncbi:MAG TPA: hypothetical protein VKM56_04645, partial [Verrucomicrobiae bacterium]|nr:hypothetical protein [Verrucomicrobiae bacterium]